MDVRAAYAAVSDYASAALTIAFLLYPVGLLIFSAFLGRQQRAEIEGSRAPKGNTCAVGPARSVFNLPWELYAIMRVKLGYLFARPIPYPSGASQQLMEDVAFCDGMLSKVSASFSHAVRQLPEKLRLAVCMFYLVLRVLDTIEDETDLSKFDLVIDLAEATSECAPKDERRRGAQRHLLRTLHMLHADAKESSKEILSALAVCGCGSCDEASLLAQYSRVINVSNALPTSQRSSINGICHRMGMGMAEYLGRDLRTGTEDWFDYNRYCHLVAGLVTEGLTHQFYSSGLEVFAKVGTAGKRALERGPTTLASNAGSFMQKANIIRDFSVDLRDGRSFWPRCHWSLYVEDLAQLVEPGYHTHAVACLNELILDALELAPSSLTYLECLENPDIFAFCAVPQVLAIMTLSEMFGNSDVFSGTVKIGRSLTARILVESGSMEGVRRWFSYACQTIRSKQCVCTAVDVKDDAAKHSMRQKEVVAAIEAALRRLHK